MQEMLSSSSTSPVLPILFNTRHQTTSTPLTSNSNNNSDEDAFIKTEKNENERTTTSICASTVSLENHNNNKLENFLFQNSKPYYNHQAFSFNNYLNTNTSNNCNESNSEYSNTNSAVAMAAALQHYNMNSNPYNIIEPQINSQNSYYHNHPALGGWQTKTDASDYYRNYEHVVAQSLEASNSLINNNEQSLNVRSNFFPYGKSQSSIIEPSTNVTTSVNNYYYNPSHNNSISATAPTSYIYNQLPILPNTITPASDETKQRFDSVSSSSSSSCSSSSSSILNHLSPIQDIIANNNNNNNKKPKLSSNLISSIKIENISNNIFQPSSSSSSSSSVSSSSSFNSSPSSSSPSSSSNPKHLIDNSLSPKISNMTQTSLVTKSLNNNSSVSSTLPSSVDIAMGLTNLSSSASNSYTSSNNNICTLASTATTNASVNNSNSTTNATESYDWMKPVKTQSNGKTRTKDKYRVVYSEPQRVELEKEFLYSKYITIKRKAELSQTLSLSERQIKIWFQNRRAKERKSNRKHKHDHGNNVASASGVEHMGCSSSSSSSSSSASSHSSSYGKMMGMKSGNFHDDNNSGESDGYSDEEDFDEDDINENENDTSSISNNNTPKKTGRTVKSKPKSTKTNTKKTKYIPQISNEATVPSLVIQGETPFQSDMHQDVTSSMPRYNFNTAVYNQQESDHQTNQSPSLLASFMNNQSNVYASSTASTFSNQYSMFNPVEINSVNANSYNINSSSSNYYQQNSAAPVAFNHHHTQSYNFINNSASQCQTTANEYSTASSSYPLHTTNPYHSQFGSLSANSTIGSYSSNGTNFLPTTMKQIITSSPLSNNSVENSNGNMLSHF